MKVLTTTPFLSGAPGDAVTCRVRIENDSNLPSAYRLRVVGFDERNVRLPAGVPSLPAGGVTEVDVELFIPDAIAPGNHAVGVEVRSERTPDAGSVAELTVSVGSLDRLLLTVNPSTVRGHKRAKFWVDVLNRDREPVELRLGGDATDGDVRIKPPVVRVEPNQRVRARGRVSGRLRFFGEPRQLPFNVSAQGRSAPVYARATYQQRPLFPRSLRTFLAVLLALSLWAGALGAGLLWWTNRGDDTEETAEAVELVDLDGDGVAETPADQLVDTDSDGVPDTPAAEAAAAAAAAEEAAAAEGPKDELPTFTLISGTVKAGETGQNDGVLITLTPITLGGVPSPEALAFRGAEQATATKLWPARYGVSSAGGLSQVRQTETVTDLSDGVDGAFILSDVLIRQTYEINFAKPGFDSQSYVVRPTADGEPVEMEIVLEPSEGALGGRVTGGGGALGNVAIDATDGTLPFATTTASEGDVGRFSLPAVNTPATYTITATLRGYGTEVIQVPLTPGEQRTDLSIDMRPGVGSIIGRVTSGGAALGGATLTVANGDDTRTTTSLTDGDVGLYNFPQLEIPGTYTVTASAPGYVTQTRLVDLAGNATGVDFDLVKTTATITGIVASDRNGPLPGAAIDISRDNLSFTAASAAAPQPGAFTVDDLPPGTYVVRFSRFDHAEQSQLVTLSAGQVFDLGTITLTFTGAPELPSTGSINVDVVDSQNAPLNDATVRILDISTRDVVAEIDGDATQSSFIFQNVPVGTYLVQAERRLYRVSETRISVGLGPQSVTAQMFLLGQVSGRLIDSLTNQQLTDYEVSISRVNADGSQTLIERVVVAPNQQPDALSGRIEWESSPNSLTTGTYRIEVTDAPPGYRVDNDQIVDPNRPAAPVMEFEISPTQEDPIQLNDIEADVYPTLTGRIYKPLLVVPDTNTVDFARVDDATLQVLLDCPGAAAQVTASLTDTVSSQPGFDTYTINPVQLEQANASGNCTLTVNAQGFATATEVLSPPLVPTDGVVDPDQIVNVAIVAPADGIGGRVEWLDARTGTRFPINGASVTTDPRVIIDFQRAQGTDIDAEPIPVFTTSPLTTSSLAGSWLLDGQVFGRTRYTFAAPNFQTGSMFVTIDENAPREVTAETNLVVADQGASDIRVTMTPVPGVINGSIAVTSINPVRYSDFTVTGTSPDGAQTVTPVISPAGGYTIANAAAGTWTVATATNNGTETPGDPRDYVLTAPPAATVNPFVGPASPVGLAATRYVEQARLDFSVVTVGGATPVPGATITIQRPGIPGSARTATVGADGTATFRGLDFNPFIPQLFGVQYTWTLTQPGFDTSTATTTFAPNGAQFGFEDDPVGLGGVVQVVAGAKPRFTVTLPRFGSLTADVVGRVGVDPTAVEDVDFSVPGATIVATRIAQFDAGGLLVPTNGPFLTATLDPADPSRFTVSGPPGAYEFTFTHPDFAGVAAAPAANPLCGFRVGCFLIQNDANPVYAQPFELNIKPVDVEVTVLTRRTGGTPVFNADITLQWGTTGTPVRQVTDASGRASFPDLLPGTTNIDAIVQLAGVDTNFPVIASIDIARFSATPGGTGTVNLTLVMPELGRSITGTIRAINSENDLVPLPAQVEIGRTYAVQDGTLDGVDVPNDAGENVIVPTPPATQVTVVPDATDATAPRTFSFDNVAGGVHTLTLSTETGYQTPSPNPIIVPLDPADPFAEDIGTQTYRANDIAVVVNVFSDEDAPDPDTPLPDATVRLISPDPDTLIPTTVAGSGVFTFGAVPPEALAYDLAVTHPLHATFNTTVSVVPSAGPTITVNVVMTPATARITGTALKDATEAAGGAVPLANEGEVRLFNGATLVAGPIPTNATGGYTFTLANPIRSATYTIQVSLPNHTTEVTTVSGVRRGRVTTAGNVTVFRHATASIVVTGVDAADPTLAVSVTPPPGTDPVTVTRTGLSFTVAGLDPEPGAGQGYRFAVSASGYFAQELPATGVFDPPIGGTQTYNVALVERRVTVTVLTSPSVPADEQSATVELRIPANGASVGAPTRVGNVYTFSRLTTADTGLVTVSRTGYRTQTAVIDVRTAPDTETVTLFPLVDLTGTVSKGGTGVNNATVTATNGTVTRTATTNASGAYSLADLDVGTWTISAAAIGYGTGNATNLVITSTSPAATDVRDITLVSRNMTVSATVQSPANTALSGATLTVAGVTGTTATDGTVTVTVPEAPTLAWTLTATGKVTQSGTITVASLTESLGTRVMVDRPTLGGVVSLAGNGTGGVTVRLCLASASPCNAAAAIATATTAAGPTPPVGTYSFTGVFPAAGTYQIRATNGTETGTVTGIVVAADGTVSPAGPYNITIA